MTDLYAVVGNPVSHSLSPQVHQLFAMQTAQNMRYSRLHAEEDSLASTLASFVARGGQGVNITAPFKQSALSFVKQSSARAEQAQAINTMQLLPDGHWYGDNTDGVGLIRALSLHYQVSLKGKRVLLYGAGGAARGVICALLAEEPECVIVINRTHAKAVNWANSLADTRVIAVALEDRLPCACDVVINTVGAMLPQNMLTWLSSMMQLPAFCYDLAYAPVPAPLQIWAARRGVAAADGIGMLIEQAAESFFVWRGVRPDTQAVFRFFAQSRSFA